MDGAPKVDIAALICAALACAIFATARAYGFALLALALIFQFVALTTPVSVH